jgi:hypothetical protein
MDGKEYSPLECISSVRRSQRMKGLEAERMKDYWIRTRPEVKMKGNHGSTSEETYAL